MPALTIYLQRIRGVLDRVQTLSRRHSDADRQAFEHVLAGIERDLKRVTDDEQRRLMRNPAARARMPLPASDARERGTSPPPVSHFRRRRP